MAKGRSRWWGAPPNYALRFIKAAVEKAVRRDPALAALLKDVRDELDRGEHSVGAIWRRERLSCPSREHLGQHLLGAAPPGLAEYVEFHLETVGCPYCLANLDDLKALQKKAKPATKPAPGGKKSSKRR